MLVGTDRVTFGENLMLLSERERVGLEGTLC
jgi:hypothetical protein